MPTDNVRLCQACKDLEDGVVISVYDSGTLVGECGTLLNSYNTAQSRLMSGENTSNIVFLNC